MLKKGGDGLLKIAESEFDEGAGVCGSAGRMFGVETERCFEFSPMKFGPFDDMAHVDLSGGQSEQYESEESAERGVKHLVWSVGRERI